MFWLTCFWKRDKHVTENSTINSEIFHVLFKNVDAQLLEAIESFDVFIRAEIALRRIHIAHSMLYEFLKNLLLWREIWVRPTAVPI